MGRARKGEAEGLASVWSIMKGTPRRLPGKEDLCASQIVPGRKLEIQSINRWLIKVGLR